jgi:hypothetical protein
MRTGQAFYGTLPRLSSASTSRVVSTARSFKKFKMTPNADDSKELPIVLLY